MASTTQTSVSATSSQSDSSRGGGRGGRNNRGHRGNVDGPGGGGVRRRGGRGRGGRGRGDSIAAGEQSQPSPMKPPLTDSGGGGTFGGRPTEDAKPQEGDANAEEVEPEVCFICASPVVHQAVSSCNHRTCHICALRLRALYKTRACAHCRTEAKFVIFTDDAVKRYEDFADHHFERSDDALGIKYEKNEIYDDTILLLRYNCPEETCDIACLGWPDLHRHVKTMHGKLMCDLCTRNKKVFTHEHELFTPQELRKHMKFGDDNPGAIDQSGFKGHPECGFCRQRFYGDDELYTHCRDKHEKCHICDRRNNGRSQQYYVNYDSLEAHFRKDHFLCPDTECLEKKFVVFESEMDMKAHQLEAHPNGMTKDSRRDARRVDISTFDYRAPHQEPRQGRQGRGRGRDPNAEPIPPSSAQPLRRDELAYQRQMAIVQSAQGTTTRNFGGQLSAPTRTEPPRANQASQQNPSVDRLSLNPTPNNAASAGSQQALTPQEEARRLHHVAVMERAQGMLKNDPSKMTDFRNRVSSYRTGTTSASDLVETFYTLFDVSSADLGKLIKELAELYENEAKRAGLLKAWNDWRAINEDYPSLPGPSGVPTNASTSSGGRRVLKLKSSTQQSSRSSVSQQASWGNVPSANTPFPSLPASANRAGVGRTGPVPWTGASSGRPSPAVSRPASTAPKLKAGHAPGADAFPALPAAAKPQTHMVGLNRGRAIRWDDPRGGTPVNAWGGAQSVGASNNASAVASEVEDDGGAPGGGKKKGKKKQTLYKFG